MELTRQPFKTIENLIGVSFTENQKFIGGTPIYVDPDVRDQVIPRGKQ